LFFEAQKTHNIATYRWGQVHLLEAVTFVVPAECQDAEILAERVIPRLQHSNSAIVLMAVRVILYLTNYISSEEKLTHFYKKLGPPMGMLYF
jgi:AP-2 complex subunit beta-1